MDNNNNISSFPSIKRDPNNIILTNEEKNLLQEKVKKSLEIAIKELNLNEEQTQKAEKLFSAKIEVVMISKIKKKLEEESKLENASTTPQMFTLEKDLSDSKNSNENIEENISSKSQEVSEKEEELSEEIEVKITLEELNDIENMPELEGIPKIETNNEMSQNTELTLFISNNNNNEELPKSDYKFISYKLHEIVKREIMDEILEKNCFEMVFLKSQITILNSTCYNLSNQEKFVKPLMEKRESLQKTLKELSEEKIKYETYYDNRDEELVKLFKNNEFSDNDKQAKDQLSKIKFSDKIITITSLNLGEEQKKLENKEKECLGLREAYEQIRYLNTEYWNSFKHRLNECNSLLQKTSSMTCEETIYEEDREYSLLQKKFTEFLKQILSLKEKARMESGAVAYLTINPKHFITSCYEENYEFYLMLNRQYISNTKEIDLFLQKLTKTVEDHLDNKIIANGNDFQIKLREYKAIREKINTQINYLKALQEELVFRMKDLYNKLNVQYRYGRSSLTDWTYMMPLVGKEDESLEKVVNDK